MSLLSRLRSLPAKLGLGRESGRPAGDHAEHRTPLSPEAVRAARAEVGDVLAETDRPLVDLLEDVQEYVEVHDVGDGGGNAFVEQLIEETGGRDGLIEPVLVRGEEVFFVCPAEYWSQITRDIGLNDREAAAVADAHQLYADRVGLSEYGPNIRVMCITVRDRRLLDLLERASTRRQDVDLPGGKVEPPSGSAGTGQPADSDAPAVDPGSGSTDGEERSTDGDASDSGSPDAEGESPGSDAPGSGSTDGEGESAEGDSSPS